MDVELGNERSGLVGAGAGEGVAGELIVGVEEVIVGPSAGEPGEDRLRPVYGWGSLRYWGRRSTSLR
jgi:hypothetical protein